MTYAIAIGTTAAIFAAACVFRSDALLAAAAIFGLASNIYHHHRP